MINFYWPIRRRHHLSYILLLLSGLLVFLIYSLIGVTNRNQHSEEKEQSGDTINTVLMEFNVNVWTPSKSANQKHNNHRIYLHETSGSRSMTFRQTCSVESAAKENPNRLVQLFMQTDHLDSIETWFFVLSQYNNIEIILIKNTDEYFAGTPLQNWYRQGIWRNSSFKMEHFSDYIRMASLIKEGGGLYMDLDFITLKPLDEKFLWNFFPFEDPDSKFITGSIFHLESDHRLIDKILQNLAERYDPSVWAAYGPALITRTIEDYCKFQRGNASSNQCRDVRLVPNSFFYPIDPENWSLYYEEMDNDTMALVENCYGVHVWNKMSDGVHLGLGRNDLYAVLAAKHCPLAFARISQFKRF